jgi:hypothetical protein
MKKRTIAYLILLLTLSQSCVIYQKTPVALSEAHDRGKVKVITNTDEKLMFKKIIQKDSIYYGLTPKRRKIDGKQGWVDITQQLNVDEVRAIYLKDQNRSNTATITITILITIPLTIIGFYIFALAISG